MKKVLRIGDIIKIRKVIMLISVLPAKKGFPEIGLITLRNGGINNKIHDRGNRYTDKTIAYKESYTLEEINSLMMASDLEEDIKILDPKEVFINW